MGLLAQVIRTFNPSVVQGWGSVGLSSALLSGLVLVAAPAVAQGPPISFALSLSVGRSPAALVAADFNRDGRLDLAVANSEGDSMSILYGGGPGGFLPAAFVATSAGPVALVSADLDRDDRPDVLLCGGIDDVVEAYRARPQRSFERSSPMSTGTAPGGVASPDLDGNGRPDIVVTNSFDGTISVYLDDAAGGFVPLGDLVTGEGFDSGPLGLDTGDLNLDGFADVVVANQMEDTVTVFFGDGTGAFPVVRGFDVDSLPTTARVADVNVDGFPDIVTVNEGSDTLVILLGDGQGGVLDRITLDTGGFPVSVAVRDLNGDGLPDLITSDSFSDVVSIYAARAAGEFEPRLAFPVGRSPFDVVVGDFNQDGRPDIATANLDDDTVSVLLNTTPYAVAHGDVDGNGTVDAADVGFLLAEFFDGDGDLRDQAEGGLFPGAWTADANTDGFVNAADLVRLQREISRVRR